MRAVILGIGMPSQIHLCIENEKKWFPKIYDISDRKLVHNTE